MKTVRVSELKASLSRFLAYVKRGEEVIVTERGLPIARLVPLTGPAPDEDARLASLERAGVLRRGASRLPTNFWRRPRPADPRSRVLGALLEERDVGP